MLQLRRIWTLQVITMVILGEEKRNHEEDAGADVEVNVAEQGELTSWKIVQILCAEYVQEFSALSLSSIVVSEASKQSPSPEEGQEIAPTDETHPKTEVEQENAQSTPPSALNPLCVSSLAESTRKRFVKFRFHDVLKGTSKTSDAKIDSGAEANVMTLSMYRHLYPERFDENGVPLPQFLRTSKRKLEAYGGVEVPHLGTVNLPCEYGGKKFMCKFFLCDIKGSMLIGLPTCEALA